MNRLITPLFLFCAGIILTPLSATASISWSTDGASMDNMGNSYLTGFQSLVGPAYTYYPAGSNVDNNVIDNSDKVTLDAAVGLLNLVPGVPQNVAINPLTFAVGWTGDMSDGDIKTNDYSLIENITVNGITHSLGNSVTHVVTFNFDSLLVNAGSPVVFGDITVTPLGWDTPVENGGGPLGNLSIVAQFELTAAAVPEPSSLIVWSMLALSLGGVGWWTRQKLTA